MNAGARRSETARNAPRVGWLRSPAASCSSRQHTLDEKIGEGAMGVVDLQPFEREVQLTAMLTHPNTVAIYDYEGLLPCRRIPRR